VIIPVSRHHSTRTFWTSILFLAINQAIDHELFYLHSLAYFARQDRMDCHQGTCVSMCLHISASASLSGLTKLIILMATYTKLLGTYSHHTHKI
jgi:hypothetical protein